MSEHVEMISPVEVDLNCGPRESQGGTAGEGNLAAESHTRAHLILCFCDFVFMDKRMFRHI